MTRRDLLRTIPFATAAQQLAWPAEQDLKITGVRLVRSRPRQPLPRYTPRPGSYWISRTAARPITVYPEYTGRRARGSKWAPDPGSGLGGFTVEISTNKGLTGYGRGNMGGGFIVENHLTKLLLGQNPLDVERLWDIMWRATLNYGRKGAVLHAISGVDIALWDLAGKVFETPVYRLLGGRTRRRLPCYATGNDVDQSVEFGFTKVKLAVQHGPADGREGLKKNAGHVRRTREILGPDGEIMLDCWMALTEQYTRELAEAVAPYRVHWIEEPLIPDDYAGFGRLKAAIDSTNIATGEHEYTRWGFRELLHHDGADIWQPEVKACGGITELRRIGALAVANDIPLIPHGGAAPEALAHLITTPGLPWAEITMPPPGGPAEVYHLYEQQRHLTRGPEGIYIEPPDTPGIGWDFEVA